MANSNSHPNSDEPAQQLRYIPELPVSSQHYWRQSCLAPAMAYGEVLLALPQAPFEISSDGRQLALSALPGIRYGTNQAAPLDEVPNTLRLSGTVTSVFGTLQRVGIVTSSSGGETNSVQPAEKFNVHLQSILPLGCPEGLMNEHVSGKMEGKDVVMAYEGEFRSARNNLTDAASADQTHLASSPLDEVVPDLFTRNRGQLEAQTRMMVPHVSTTQRQRSRLTSATITGSSLNPLKSPVCKNRAPFGSSVEEFNPIQEPSSLDSLLSVNANPI
ncbi:hypothetical protein B0H11DRAFT_2224959 [Mycena galericulata]|nr:hypothetical protein B0H11DRAFT_2224959 [Mycena galericulata]